jgi:hypothetical protein
MDLEYTYMLMLGTVDILDDDYGTDTTDTNNSATTTTTTTTTTDADHVLISFKIVCNVVVLGGMKFRHCPYSTVQYTCSKLTAALNSVHLSK